MTPSTFYWIKDITCFLEINVNKSVKRIYFGHSLVKWILVLGFLHALFPLRVRTHLVQRELPLSYNRVESTASPSSISNLTHFKDKIVRLHSQQLQSTMYDKAPADCLLEEHPALHQFVRRHRRGSSRLVRSVRDSDGTIHTSPMGIATTFTTFLRTKYTNIEADPESIRILA